MAPGYDGLAMVTDPSEAEIRERLAPLSRRADVRLLVLFGSRARGLARPSSDIDVGVLVDGAFEAVGKEIVRLLSTDRVDVANLRRVTPLLAMAIAKEGKPVYERDPGEFASFASLALRRYNDTAKFRRLRENGLKAFVKERGL